MYKANLSGSVHATNLVATCRHTVACIARPFEAPSAQRCDSDRERFPIAAVSMSFPMGACLVIGKLEVASHPVAVAAFTFVVSDMKSKATSKPKGSEHPIILEHPFTRNFLIFWYILVTWSASYDLYWWPRGGVVFGGIYYCNCFIFVSDFGIPNDSTNTYLFLWNRGILEFQTTQITWSLVTNGWTSIERATAPFTPNRSCLTIGSTAESGKIRPRPGSCFWVGRKMGWFTMIYPSPMAIFHGNMSSSTMRCVFVVHPKPNLGKLYRPHDEHKLVWWCWEKRTTAAHAPFWMGNEFDMLSYVNRYECTLWCMDTNRWWFLMFQQNQQISVVPLGSPVALHAVSNHSRRSWGQNASAICFTLDFHRPIACSWQISKGRKWTKVLQLHKR